MVLDPKQYLKSEALDMETKVLQFFNWDLMTPTAATYIDYFYVKCLPKSAINNSSRVLVDKYLDKTIGITDNDVNCVTISCSDRDSILSVQSLINRGIDYILRQR